MEHQVFLNQFSRNWPQWFHDFGHNLYDTKGNNIDIVKEINNELMRYGGKFYRNHDKKWCLSFENEKYYAFFILSSL